MPVFVDLVHVSSLPLPSSQGNLPGEWGRFRLPLVSNQSNGTSPSRSDMIFWFQAVGPKRCINETLVAFLYPASEDSFKPASQPTHYPGCGSSHTRHSVKVGGFHRVPGGQVVSQWFSDTRCQNRVRGFKPTAGPPSPGNTAGQDGTSGSHVDFSSQVNPFQASAIILDCHLIASPDISNPRPYSSQSNASGQYPAAVFHGKPPDLGQHHRSLRINANSSALFQAKPASQARRTGPPVLSSPCPIFKPTASASSSSRCNPPTLSGTTRLMQTAEDLRRRYFKPHP